jgi:hypothetical protein
MVWNWPRLHAGRLDRLKHRTSFLMPNCDATAKNAALSPFFTAHSLTRSHSGAHSADDVDPGSGASDGRLGHVG